MKAFNEGIYARSLGKTRESNPHFDEAKRSAWNRGWDEMDKKPQKQVSHQFEKKEVEKKEEGFVGFVKKAIRYLVNVKCPQCNDCNSTKKVGQQTVASYDELQTIPTEVKHYDRNGQRNGSSWGSQQMVFRIWIIDEYYECEKCSHSWANTKKESKQL